MKLPPKTIDLRDYFAAMALSDLISGDNDYEEECLRREDYDAFCLNIAESAYCFADAMMKARAL